MKKITLCLTLALVLTAACTDPNDGEMFVQPTELESEMTATSILERDAEEFSLWVELLKHADYYNALKNPDTRATVFCPNNDAIKKYLAENGYASVSDIPADYARKLAKVHIIPNNLIQEDQIDTLASQGGYTPMEMPYLNLYGSQLTLCYGYSVTDVDDDQREPDSIRHCADSIFINNQARLEKFTSMSCSNANLYTMGDVIIPLTEDILQQLDKLSEYSIFAEAIRQSGYADEITVQETADDDESNAVVTRFSCLAVPDDVYHAAGITDIASLQNYLSRQGSGDDALLLNYVKYHFLTREYKTSEIFDTTKVDQTVIFDTKYAGQVFTVRLSSDGEKTINDDIRILRSDVEARNGLIHKVDHVMPVFHPTPVRVIWDFCNSADIIALVNDYGQQIGLPNIFFSAIDNKERQIDLSSANDNTPKYEGSLAVSSFTCKFNESNTKTSKFRHVAFYKEAYESKRNPTVSTFGSYMNNMMFLNLGYSGWIEFTTPSIIAGKYDVILHHCAMDDIKKLYNAGTRVRFNLDSYETEKLLYKGQSNKEEGIIATTIWEDITFDTSGYHTFKITMRDPQAKSSSSYMLPLDYLEFVPKSE